MHPSRKQTNLHDQLNRPLSERELAKVRANWRRKNQSEIRSDLLG